MVTSTKPEISSSNRSTILLVMGGIARMIIVEKLELKLKGQGFSSDKVANVIKESKK